MLKTSGGITIKKLQPLFSVAAFAFRSVLLCSLSFLAPPVLQRVLLRHRGKTFPETPAAGNCVFYLLHPLLVIACHFLDVCRMLFAEVIGFGCVLCQIDQLWFSFHYVGFFITLATFATE